MKILAFILTLGIIVIVLFEILIHSPHGNIDGDDHLVDKKGFPKKKIIPFIILGLAMGLLLVLFSVLG